MNQIQYDGPAAAAHLATLSIEDAQNFLDLTYGIKGQLGQILDDGRFMNHSVTPNCITDMVSGCTYALRDIDKDEELFEDYHRFEHPDFLFPLLEFYNCAPNYYELPPEPHVYDHDEAAVAFAEAKKIADEAASAAAAASKKFSVRKVVDNGVPLSGTSPTGVSSVDEAIYDYETIPTA